MRLLQREAKPLRVRQVIGNRHADLDGFARLRSIITTAKNFPRGPRRQNHLIGAKLDDVADCHRVTVYVESENAGLVHVGDKMFRPNDCGLRARGKKG